MRLTGGRGPNPVDIAMRDDALRWCRIFYGAGLGACLAHIGVRMIVEQPYDSGAWMGVAAAAICIWRGDACRSLAKEYQEKINADRAR